MKVEDIKPHSLKETRGLNIFVFLNRKLISVDTIAPLLLEINDKTKVSHKFFLICPDYETLDIIQNNSTIYNSLCGFCTFLTLGRRGFSGVRANRLVNVLLLIPFLISVIWAAIFKKAIFFHFKLLDKKPWNLFFKLAPSRTYCFQSSPISYSALEEKITSFNGNKSVKHLFVGKRVGWDGVENTFEKEMPLVVLEPPHGLPVWRKQLVLFDENYQLKVKNADNNGGFALFILSSMDRAQFLANPDGYFGQFVKTLEIIFHNCVNLHVKIKMHPATSNHTSNKIIAHVNDLKARGCRVSLVNGHPQLESVDAKFCVANVFSTTFYFVSLNNVPTIEYTNYSDEVLAITDCGSMRPDLVSYFIQNDEIKLAGLVRSLCKVNKNNIRHNNQSSHKKTMHFIQEMFRDDSQDCHKLEM